MHQTNSFDKSTDQHHWLVVDAIRMPDIEEQAYKHEPYPELLKLFSGSHFEHLIDISPVVFNFSGSKELVELLTNDFAMRTSSVIFTFDEQKNEEERFKHLQNLLTVTIENNITFFRYYSSEFWSNVSSALTITDKSTILGPFNSLTWVDEKLNWQKITKNNDIQDPIKKDAITLNSPVFSRLA
ncbi:MAG: DUF4123 domain-containing protein [Gammaproteobacteria bacterium]|nr:DUF4123 domain-containing protein [Gammaproteobacteria bacterium]